MNNNQQKKLAAEKHNQKLEDDRQLVAYNKWLRENTQNQRLRAPVVEYLRHRSLGVSRKKALILTSAMMSTFIKT